jgi:hypothetical protein
MKNLLQKNKMSKIIIFVRMIYILREIIHAFNVSFKDNYINVNR